MTTVITLFEDVTRNISELHVPTEDIRSFQQVLGGNLRLDIDGNIRIMHYVGFLQKNNTRLQILPKIYVHDATIHETEEISEATRFIITMLADTGFLNYKPTGASYFSALQSDLFEILIHLFVVEFQKVFHQNRFNDYVLLEDNLSFIKGKVDFGKTISRNTVYRHMHIQQFDEFTIDNPLIAFLKATLLRLLQVTRNADNKRLLRKNVILLQDVTDVPITHDLISSIRFNRKNQEFLPLFNLAKLFFNRSISGLQAGKDHTFSFLVPLNELFEAYIGAKLSYYNDELHVFEHHRREIGVLVKQASKDVLGIKPDFTFSVGKQICVILDAKYKQAVQQGTPGSSYILRTNDIYQLITYASYCGCTIIMPIYPKFKGTTADLVIGKFDVMLHGRILTLIPLQIELGNEQEFTRIMTLLKSACSSA